MDAPGNPDNNKWAQAIVSALYDQLVVIQQSFPKGQQPTLPTYAELWAIVIAKFMAL